MKRISAAEIRWIAQDLRERTVLAQAERVKLERHIREIVLYPPNRGGAVPRQAPDCTDPEVAVDQLRKMSRLAYLARPGLKNRIKPEVLLARWTTVASAAEKLWAEVDEMEAALEAAGLGEPPRQVPVVKRSRQKPAMNGSVGILWDDILKTKASNRTLNALYRAGYATVGNVVSASATELKDGRMFGEGSLAEVRRVLALHGLALAGE
jgi:hypothetical protein